LVMIMVSIMENRSMQDYPNKSIISKSSQFTPVLAIHFYPTKLMLTYTNQNLNNKKREYPLK